MPRTKLIAPLQTNIPKDKLEDVKAFAKSQGKEVADVMRLALEQYMKANGKPVELRVSRGPRKAS